MLGGGGRQLWWTCVLFGVDECDQEERWAAARWLLRHPTLHVVFSFSRASSSLNKDQQLTTQPVCTAGIIHLINLLLGLLRGFLGSLLCVFCFLLCQSRC